VYYRECVVVSVLLGDVQSTADSGTSCSASSPCRQLPPAAAAAAMSGADVVVFKSVYVVVVVVATGEACE